MYLSQTNSGPYLSISYPRPQATPRLYLAAVEKKSGEGLESKLRHGPEMVDSVST